MCCSSLSGVGEVVAMAGMCPASKWSSASGLLTALQWIRHFDVLRLRPQGGKHRQELALVKVQLAMRAHER